MKPEDLLLRRLDELHQLINSSDEYEVLRASATIRQLFLDRTSLVDVVNRTYQRKLLFTVGEHVFPRAPNLPDPDVWCVVDSIDPRRAPPGVPRISKSRKQFFSIPVGVVRGEEYTIKDVSNSGTST